MTEKLKFNMHSMGDWVINFRYKDKLLTLDYIKQLVQRHLESLSNEGLDLYDEMLKHVRQERAKPRKLEIDPWGKDVA